LTNLSGKNLTETVGTLSDTKSLMKACRNIDTVFHVAAYARDWGTRKEFFDVNQKLFQDKVQPVYEKYGAKLVAWS
jgi:nucleoside-diphosphate-sugar epimerase